MKKNLKKVISAVIALALSASSIATVSFAKSFSDVPATASYAEAVDVLSNLGIIDGKGEGKFDPDGNVKRSEAAKLIAGMVNALSAAEKKKGQTSFDDVSGEHWASGYIQYGYENKWINGKGDNKFDPDGNVKVEELVKMVVVNMGWTEEYMLNFGQYPLVYTEKAEAYDVVDGGAVDYKAPATRAQTAEIIYNAMKAPMAKESGTVWSDSKGKWISQPVAQDPDSEDKVTYYRSLLSEKFNTYVVEGSIIATAKTPGNYDLEAGEVVFQPSKTETYKKEVICDGKGNITGTIKAGVGATDAADYLNTYATAIISIDEDDVAEILAFVPSSKNQTVTLDAAWFDEDECVAKDLMNTAGNGFKDKAKLVYYPSADAAKSKDYKLDKEAKLYVNGVEITTLNQAAVEKYITLNTVGKVELVDVYKNKQVPDGLYDFIYVDYYATARVSGISGDRIVFAKYVPNTFDKGSIDLDEEKVEDGDLSYEIYLNGEEISLGEIKKDDILSVKFNTVDGSDKSEFFEIYVSRDVANGKLTSVKDKTIILGGEEYARVEAGTFNGMAMSNEYDLYLDIFGRVYAYDKTVSNAKYGILVGAYNDGMYDHGTIRIFTDGKIQTFEADTKAIYDTAYDLTVKAATKVEDASKQVVEYTLKNKAITKMTVLTAKGGSNSEFNASTGRVSGIKLSKSSVVIDAIEYQITKARNDIKLSSYDKLVDDNEYEIFGFGSTDSSGAYPFAIITKGASSYNKDTRLAVATGNNSEATDEQDNEVIAVEVVEGGEVKVLNVDLSATIDGAAATIDTNCIKEGEIFVYGTDTDGLVDEIFKLGAVEAKYADAVKDAFDNDYINEVVDFAPWALFNKWTRAWNPTTTDKISVVYAPIVEISNSGDITIAQIKSNVTDTTIEVAEGDTPAAIEGGIAVLDVTDETKVALYDYGSKETKRVTPGYTSDFMASEVSAYEDIATGTIDWAKAKGDNAPMNFVFAKVVNDVVTDAVMIIAD